MDRSSLPRPTRWQAGLVAVTATGAVLVGGGIALADGPGDAPATGTDQPAPGSGAPVDGDRVGSVDDLAVGDRVEVRGSDGTATEVREVRATVDGTVVDVDGTDLTVVTVPGLRVDVDAAALPDLPAVGDRVHLSGTASEDGSGVVAETTEGPR